MRSPDPPPRSLSPGLVGLAVAAGLTLVPAAAGAYCLTSTCEGGRTGTLCNPPLSSDCGIPILWHRDCVGVSLHAGASTQVDLETAERLLIEAFDRWQDADCGDGERPSIEVSYLGPVACDQREYNQQGGNANVVVFRDDEWPHGASGSTLALTTLTYDLETGAIFDADLELNSATTTLTTGDEGVAIDLPSILTHEAGHMLGLGHSPVAEATMTPHYIPGDIGLRTLDQDDIDAVCAAYPPGEESGVCDPTPRHGYALVCAPVVSDDEGGCTCRMAPAPGKSGGVAALGLLAALLAARRRTARG